MPAPSFLPDVNAQTFIFLGYGGYSIADGRFSKVSYLKRQLFITMYTNLTFLFLVPLILTDHIEFTHYNRNIFSLKLS